MFQNRFNDVQRWINRCFFFFFNINLLLAFVSNNKRRAIYWPNLELSSVSLNLSWDVFRSRSIMLLYCLEDLYNRLLMVATIIIIIISGRIRGGKVRRGTDFLYYFFFFAYPNYVFTLKFKYLCSWTVAFQIYVRLWRGGGGVLNNCARGTQILNRWTELFYLIFPSSSTDYNIKLELCIVYFIIQIYKSMTKL